MALNDYILLGRSGLRVSPMALGTMTFGSDWGPAWSADDDVAARMLDAYMERGGNFIDTANFYTHGQSEALLGKLLQGRRDRAVLATKYTLNLDPGDPNGGGNHRKSMMRAVDASLRRLQTDYIDLLYLHIWDGTTPVEEVMRGFDDLARAGKLLYAGVSDLPAWQVARMQTIADLRGWTPLVALQIEYSLAQRTVERDLLPMADALGLSVLAWSPLAMGVLTGKYSRADLPGADNGSTVSAGMSRREGAQSHAMLTERNLAIGEQVVSIARQIGATPAQVALAWLLHRAGRDSIARNPLPIVGARTFEQFEDNLAALDLQLPPQLMQQLDDSSAIELGFPHDFMRMDPPRSLISGGTTLLPRAA